jgi:ABC-type glycerol-3-phosphate transport system substrate-binding protein
LIQPLDELLYEGITGNLYSFARVAGQFDGKLIAIQYVADLEHIAYLTSQVQSPSDNWSKLLDARIPYLFPLAAPQPSSSASQLESVQHAVLSQYISTGATVDPATRQPLLEYDPLVRLLDFYRIAYDDGVLPPGALDLSELDAVWGVYVQGKVPIAYVSARRYLAEREALRGSGFAAAPGWAGPVVPIASGWAFAVVTTDPERQRAAADLIAWLLQPENAGAWSLAAGWLPASPEALDQWGRVSYYEFLDTQLRVATSHPIGEGNAQNAARLQSAILAVLQDGLSPAEAAQAALDTGE